MKKFNIKPYKHLVSIKYLWLNGKFYDEGSKKAAWGGTVLTCIANKFS